jgi:WD40 repeat protein
MTMRAAFVSILIWLTACGVPKRPPGGDDDDRPATLSISPATSDHLLLNNTPALQDFTATLTYDDGSTRDVTTDTTFTIGGGLGAFAANELTIVAPGEGEVYATSGDRNATATVTAHLRLVRVDPTLSPNTPDLFGGVESPDLAPVIRYPSDNVAMPRNLGDFEIHWTGGGLDVFEASLKSTYADIRIYAPGGNGLAAAGANASWAQFTVPEWTAATATDATIQFAVRGVATASPGTVHAAAPRTIQLGNEPMGGGIYYWASTSTQGGPSGIFRHDMADAGLPAEEYMTTNQTSGRCVACHAVSRDGTRMTAAYDGGPQALGTVVDVATKVAQPASIHWTFSALSPDGKQLLAIYGYQLVVRDSDTQAELATMPETPVTHPELSPDGTRLAYVKPTTLNWDWMFGGGQIYTRTYDPVTHAFGPEQPLVTGGGNNYYPSWSPDGEWIVFNRSDDMTGSGAYDNASAEVWVVKADGSAPPVQLTAANQGLGLTNSWTRFAPFEQTMGANHERVFWLTVSSKRDFGTRLIGTGAPQLWMTAFFPDRTAPDPGAPAFRLPFQSLSTHNHAAQWTEQIVVVQ